MRHKAAAWPIWMAAIAVGLFMFMERAPGIMAAGSAVKSANDHPQQQTEPIILNVVLERIYLDGEMSEETIQEPVTSLADFWAKYDQWQLASISETKLVFRKQVDDISPLLKANGYFGVTDKGVLTIFNGRPDRSKIIQSFFQIDLKKLESHKQEELFHGIPIKTKDRYMEVLETFKPYSTSERKENK
ncbi:BofC C-terminal domain-containing protein [Bacillota bacterium Lsc_1132]